MGQQYVYTDKDKSNALALYLENVSKQNDSLGIKQHTNRVNSRVKECLVGNSIDINTISLTSPYKLKMMIKKLKNKKSSGPDKINNINY